jgi:hypothetical protein
MNPRASFLHIFLESPPCALMRLRQVVRDNAPGLSDRVLLERLQASDEACAVDAALC